MNELIQNQKGMTSIEIAEVTGKQHAHVMRDIRNILSQCASESNFGLWSYTDANRLIISQNGNFRNGIMLKTTIEFTNVLSTDMQIPISANPVDSFIFLLCEIAYRV